MSVVPQRATRKIEHNEDGAKETIAKCVAPNLFQQMHT